MEQEKLSSLKRLTFDRLVTIFETGIFRDVFTIFKRLKKNGARKIVQPEKTDLWPSRYNSQPPLLFRNLEAGDKSVCLTFQTSVALCWKGVDITSQE